jgi:hypothetical protein
MANEIKCINKTNRSDPHDRIQSIGGPGWKISQQTAITYIENGTYSFYVSRGGATADVIVATHNGHKYIKTTNDGIHPDNLLALPECP